VRLCASVLPADTAELRIDKYLSQLVPFVFAFPSFFFPSSATGPKRTSERTNERANERANERTSERANPALPPPYLERYRTPLEPDPDRPGQLTNIANKLSKYVSILAAEEVGEKKSHSQIEKRWSMYVEYHTQRFGPFTKVVHTQCPSSVQGALT